MPSFGMFRRVALVRTDVSKECSAFDIGVTKLGEFFHSVRWLLLTATVVLSPPILVTMMI
jgi:hypothetical protein